MKYFLSILTILIVTSSCSKKVSGDILIKIPKTISSIPVYELNGKNVDNRKIIVEFYQDHIVAMAEFINNDISIFFTGFNQGLNYYLENRDITLLTTPVWGISSLVVSDKSLESLEDLIGKNVLVPFQKSPLDLQLKTILKRQNLENSIEIGYEAIGRQIPLLIAGKTDGIAIPEPFTAKLLAQNDYKILFSFYDKWKEINNGEGRTPQVSLFVKTDFSESNKNFLLKLIGEIKTNISNINDDSALIKYSEIFEIDKTTLKSAIQRTHFEIPDREESIELSSEYEEIIENIDIPLDFFFEY